jgi:hypothetical protein
MRDPMKKIENDRGIIGKIEQWSPGFAGYARREDRREADRIVRHFAADQIAGIRKELQDVIADCSDLAAVKPLGRCVTKAEKLENTIRHADQGYTGFFAQVVVSDDELMAIYDNDRMLLEHVSELALQVKSEISQTDDLASGAKALEKRLKRMDELFAKRDEIATGLA